MEISTTRQCLESGVWSGDEPSCTQPNTSNDSYRIALLGAGIIFDLTIGNFRSEPPTLMICCGS